MPSSYSTNLKIELQATGENSGTWGTITNTNLGTALEQAIVGYGNPSYASDANLTLTYTDTNAAQAARALVLNVTSAVSLTGTRELVVPTIQKQYIVQNNTTGSQSITVKTSAGTGITVPNGRKAHLYVNGTDVIFMDDFVDINGGSIDGTTIGANSAAAGNFTTVDTTNIEVTNLKAKDGTAAGSIADSTGVVTLGSSVLTTTDINGGTIDGTTIGGSSAAAGTFTTLTTSSTVTLNGGTANGVLYLNGSKVATSGSALTFDGTTLGVNTGVVAGTALSLTGNYVASGSVAFINFQRVGGAVAGTLGYDDANIAIRFGTTTNHSTIFLQNNSEAMRLTSTGLGIGTSSPAVKLDIAGASTTQVRVQMSGQADVRLLSDTGTGITGTYSNHPFTIKTNSADVMSLTAAGNVGIGTSSPTHKLQVSGSGRFGSMSTGPGLLSGSSDTFQVGLNQDNTNTTNTQVWAEYVNGASSASWAIRYRTANDTGTASTRLYLDAAAGNLGLGVTPSAWGSSYRVLQLGSASLDSYIVGGANNFVTGYNFYRDSSDVFRYVNNAAATRYSQSGGVHSWFYAPSGTAGNTISFTQAMTLTAAGELCVGATAAAISNAMLTVYNPAATSAHIFLQNTTTGTGNNGARLLMSGNDLYITNKENAPMIFETNDTERARIDSSGNLILGSGGLDVSGTGGTSTAFNIRAGSGYAMVYGQTTATTTNSGAVQLVGATSGASAGGAAEILGVIQVAAESDSSTNATGYINFYTGSGGSATERARITSGGYFKASNAGTYGGSTASYHELRQSTDEQVCLVTNTSSSLTGTVRGMRVFYTAASPNNTDNYFVYCDDSTALRAGFRSNGGLANYQSNNVDLSDARTKKDITPAASMWDKIGALEIVTYKYNDQTHDDVNVGVIAQQVESVEPVWVDNDGFGKTSDGEEPLKTVYTKDIYFAAIKALQEAMSRIEKLEAEVAALKGA